MKPTSHSGTFSLQYSPFLPESGPCGQIEQLACSRPITLHGLSDRAVTPHRFRVDKYTLMLTHSYIQAVDGEGVHCAAVLLGQWSREQGNVPLGAGQQGKDSAV